MLHLDSLGGTVESRGRVKRSRSCCAKSPTPTPWRILSTTFDSSSTSAKQKESQSGITSQASEYSTCDRAQLHNSTARLLFGDCHQGGRSVFELDPKVETAPALERALLAIHGPCDSLWSQLRLPGCQSLQDRIMMATQKKKKRTSDTCCRSGIEGGCWAFPGAEIVGAGGKGKSPARYTKRIVATTVRTSRRVQSRRLAVIEQHHCRRTVHKGMSP
jgi:hypothetical protein